MIIIQQLNVTVYNVSHSPAPVPPEPAKTQPSWLVQLFTLLTVMPAAMKDYLFNWLSQHGHQLVHWLSHFS
ncbi:MAG: hypothetical protein JWP57_4346 [Spirosoma sp.]|nr:hypothetical protein [Spirosoma sp.]